MGIEPMTVVLETTVLTNSNYPPMVDAIQKILGKEYIKHHTLLVVRGSPECKI